MSALRPRVSAALGTSAHVAAWCGAHSRPADVGVGEWAAVQRIARHVCRECLDIAHWEALQEDATRAVLAAWKAGAR